MVGGVLLLDHVRMRTVQRSGGARSGAGRRTQRVPGRVRPVWHAVTTLRDDTKAEYLYDYAGQDPMNSYDLDGTFIGSYASDLGFDGSIPDGAAPMAPSPPTNNGLLPTAGDMATAAKKVGTAVAKVGKKYGLSCLSDGAVGALAGGGVGGFVVGCGTGVINVYLDDHHPVLGAAMTAVMVGHGANRIFIESKFGKGLMKAMGQAVCAAFYPTCKSAGP